MDKLFEKYKNYINYPVLNRYVNSTGFWCVYDNIGAFIDTLCRQLIKKMNIHYDVVYIIMSPYHKSDVIYGILAITNGQHYKIINFSHHCKVYNLYTKEMSEKDCKYLDFCRDLFDFNYKKQQKF